MAECGKVDRRHSFEGAHCDSGPPVPELGNKQLGPPLDSALVSVSNFASQARDGFEAIDVPSRLGTLEIV